MASLTELIHTFSLVFSFSVQQESKQILNNSIIFLVSFLGTWTANLSNIVNF